MNTEEKNIEEEFKTHLKYLVSFSFYKSMWEDLSYNCNPFLTYTILLSVFILIVLVSIFIMIPGSTFWYLVCYVINFIKGSK